MTPRFSLQQNLQFAESYFMASELDRNTPKQSGRYLESMPVNMTAKFSFPESLTFNEPNSPTSESEKSFSERPDHYLSSIPIKNTPDNRTDSLFNSLDTKYCERIWSELRMYEDGFDKLRAMKASLYRNDT